MPKLSDTERAARLLWQSKYQDRPIDESSEDWLNICMDAVGMFKPDPDENVDAIVPVSAKQFVEYALESWLGVTVDGFKSSYEAGDYEPTGDDILAFINQSLGLAGTPDEIKQQ